MPKKNKQPQKFKGREFTAEELTASRPPSWAKGKMIGMWHATKNMKRFTEGKEAKDPKSKPLPTIRLNVGLNKIKSISKLLNKIGSSPVLPNVQAVSLGSDPRDRYKHVEDSAFKSIFLKSISDNTKSKSIQTCQLRRDAALDARYIAEEEDKLKHEKVIKMAACRRRLPSWAKRQELLDMLETHNVVLVTGETGCGKTTQVAQFILENDIMSGRGSVTSILCTQPRRISAITVAERVAAERGERLGQSVGYQIRLEKVLPRSRGSILYCTTGVLLQYMHGDPFLSKVSTIIVDEIHERNTVSDFVITLLKDVAPLRPDLKILLMSATLNAERFSKYLADCPTLHIPGFAYSVKEYYLEDVLELVPFAFPKTARQHERFAKKTANTGDAEFLDAFHRDLERSSNYSKKVLEGLKNPQSNEIQLQLIFDLIQHICSKSNPGAILVFLPGWDKISDLNKLLTKSGRFPQSLYWIIPLHSLMPTTNQKKVFERPPRGVRKIVLATNIAETSITIDDVVYVIDCGKIKIKNFDVDSNVSTLQEQWVSLANAKQRRGRAGRVQNGICYHLYSRGREMLLETDTLPEMLRTPLEEVVLQGKFLRVGRIGEFLLKVMDPPSERAIQMAIDLLVAMNALDNDENLTPLGYHLATLPVGPQAGKMLLFGSLFSVLDPITSIATALEFKDPFVLPLGKEREVDAIRESFDAGHCSDHLIVCKVVAQYKEARGRGDDFRFANKNFLSVTVLDQLCHMKRQLVTRLHDMKYAPNCQVDSSDNNRNTANLPLVTAILCAGLFPNVACVRQRNHKKQLRTVVHTIDHKEVLFHPKSIFKHNTELRSSFVVYFEKLKSSNIYLYDCTMVYPLALIFFCHDMKVHDRGAYKFIEIGSFARFRCTDELTQLIVKLRRWLDWLLEHKMCHPGVTDWSEGSVEATVLRAIIELVTIQEADGDDDSSSSSSSSDDDDFELNEKEDKPTDAWNG